MKRAGSRRGVWPVYAAAALAAALAGVRGVTMWRAPHPPRHWWPAPAPDRAADERASPPASPAPGTPPASDTLAPEAADPPGAAQLRALWVDAFHDGIKTPAQVDQLIADAQLAGVNTLIVQVRRRGDAYYTRTREPRTDDPALIPEFDALQRTIERAHAARPRLEVHAWIATVALWKWRGSPPANPAHVYHQHGPRAAGPDNWLSLNQAGEAWDGENYMLDPGHPAAARYIAGVAEELARNYDVDGIHLDLVRYAGEQWGYNPVSLARYDARYGAGGATSGAGGGSHADQGPGVRLGVGAPAPGDPRWQQWRRDQVTALVRRIYLDCLALKPRLKVSAATIGWGAGPVDERSWRATSAYRNVFQDWAGWLEEGIVDVVLPMTYDDERQPAQRAWFDQWLGWQKERKGQRQVAAGVGLYLNRPADGLAQIRRVLAPAASGARLDGVALYSYAVTNAPAPGSEAPATPNAEIYRALSGPSALHGEAAPPFAAAARPPPMPWKDAPAAHLRGIAAVAGEPLDGAAIRLEGPASATLHADGNGYFGFPGLPLGTYGLTLEHQGAVRKRTTVELARASAGQVATVYLDAS